MVLPVQIAGISKVNPVNAGDSALNAGAPAPANWNITATTGGTTTVISAGTPLTLKRGTTYTIGSQLRTNPAPASNTSKYSRMGTLECVDESGNALPAGVVNAANSTVTVGATTKVSGTISCTIAQATSQVGLVTQVVGGASSAPGQGWALTGTGAGNFTVDSALAKSETLPGTYTMNATLPQGYSLLRVERLNLAQPTCTPYSQNPSTAPDSCWVKVGTKSSFTATQTVGERSVYRLIGASAADMPDLPITGGLGSWQFVAGGIASLAFAAIGLLLHRRRQSQVI